MLKEAYCSFELAKLLKEKGFDEKTLTYYEGEILVHGEYFEWNRSPLGHISAPTHQMAMKWLREKHFIIVIKPGSFYADGECSSWNYEIWADDNFEGEFMNFNTYERTAEAALKYCLETYLKKG